MTRPPRRALAGLLAAVLTFASCSDYESPTQPAAPRVAVSLLDPSHPTTAALVRQLAAERGILAFPRPAPVRPALVQLGQVLFFDKILSGNRDIACATCHLPRFATGDGKSLAVGQGGNLLGPPRTHPNGAFIGRNSPPIFNLSAMRHLFWDGRVELDNAGTVHTPAGAQVTPAMQRVFEFGAVSALAMFPVTNRAEMRADANNELAALADDDFTGIWAALMQRLGAIGEYRAMFQAAYPGTRFEDMTFAHASNAMAGFFVERLTFANTPWDKFLGGNDRALTTPQLEGARTFLTLKCSECHNGTTFSDEAFHNVAVAQIGPGVGNGVDGRDDFGRMNVTGDPADRYRFRTTPLRNVELTAPYGHDGAIVSLRDFVEHYSESAQKLFDYDAGQLEPALRGTLLDNASAILAQRDPILEGVVIPPAIIDQLMAYMSALTDESARDLTRNSSRLIPTRVPSGLPVDRP